MPLGRGNWEMSEGGRYSSYWLGDDSQHQQEDHLGCIVPSLSAVGDSVSLGHSQYVVVSL